MSMLERLAAWIPGQWEKAIITAFLVGTDLLAPHLWARHLSCSEISAQKRRIHLVSKARVMCLRGYWHVTLAQPFKNGDVIEFPNGLFLTHPLINSSPNGDYALHTIQIPVPVPERVTHDLDRLEAAALAAAERVRAERQEEAMAHFLRACEEHVIDLPSGKAKASREFSNPEHLVLVVQAACPSGQRANVEQAVFRAVWHTRLTSSRAVLDPCRQMARPDESTLSAENQFFSLTV